MDKPRKNIEYFRFRDLEHYEKDIQKERINKILPYAEGLRYGMSIIIPNISDCDFLYDTDRKKVLGHIYVKGTKGDKKYDLIKLIEVEEEERGNGYGPDMINQYHEIHKRICIPEEIAQGSEDFWIKSFSKGVYGGYLDIHNRESMEDFLKEAGFVDGDRILNNWCGSREAGEVWKALDELAEKDILEEKDWEEGQLE